MTSAVVLVVLLAQLSNAQQKCTPQELLGRVCQHFEENADKRYLTTSDGGKIINPRFKVSQKTYSDVEGQAQVVTTGANDIHAQNDLLLNFQIEVEELLESAAPKSWSKKTKLTLMAPNNLLRLLIQSFGSDESLTSKVYQLELPMIPEDLEKSASPVKVPTPEIYAKLKAGLGKENLEKLREIYKRNFPKSHLDTKLEVRYTEPERDEFNKTSDVYKSAARQKRLFDYAIASVEESIRNGRPLEALSDEERNLLSRVTNVRIELAESHYAKSEPLCNTKSPQAFFDPLTYKLAICESALTLPDANLVSFLAHEIGHSIDTCESTAPRQDRNFEPIAMNKHPLYSVRSCLVQTGKFQEVTQKDIDTAVELHVEAYKRTGSKNEEELNAVRAQHKDHFSKYPECNGTTLKSSEMPETISDVYASYASAKFLKEFPPKNFTDFIGMESDFFSDYCDESYSKEQVAKTYDLSILKERHAVTYNRLVNVRLSFPGIAEAAGCQVHQTHNCFSQFDWMRSKPAQNVTPAVKENQGAQQ